MGAVEGIKDRLWNPLASSLADWLKFRNDVCVTDQVDLAKRGFEGN